MWICLNDAFLSVVVDKTSGLLKVRARCKSHLRVAFPRRKVHQSDKTDYRYRVFVTREEVVKTLTKRVMGLEYPNFKDSVKDPALHDMYLLWWADHYQLQKKKETTSAPS